MQKCNVCRLDKIYWDPEKIEENIASKVSGLEPLEIKHIELPSIVPIISLKEPSSFCWDAINTSTIIINYTDLIDKEILPKIVKVRDIHSYLNFDGKVLLSSIMPDRLLVDINTFYYFINTIKWFHFDGAIAWDAPVYIDIPLYDSWVNLLKGLLLTYEIAKRRIPVVGLVKGNMTKQIEFSLKTLDKIGIKSVALHATEYLWEKASSTARQILYTYFRLMSKHADSILLIGVMSPSLLRFITETFLDRQKVSIAGLSWFLDAKDGFIYSEEGREDAISNYVECSCSACTETAPEEFTINLKARARHNLNYIANTYNEGLSPTIQIYDLVLNANEKVFFVSDLHIGRGGTLLDTFLEFLKDKKPKHIVFLGDTFDFIRHTPELAHTFILFKVLREIGASVFVVKGCSDGTIEEFLLSLDALTMKGRPKHRLLLWTESQDERLKQVLFDLYRFYRSAKNSLRIKLAEEGLVIAEHGHRIIEDPSKPIPIITKRLENINAQRKSRWFIIGHLHRTFIREKERVASTGCWTIDPPYEGLRIRKEDVGSALVLSGEGTVEVIRMS